MSTNTPQIDIIRTENQTYRRTQLQESIKANYKQSALFTNPNSINFSKEGVAEKTLNCSKVDFPKAFQNESSSNHFMGKAEPCINLNQNNKCSIVKVEVEEKDESDNESNKDNKDSNNESDNDKETESLYKNLSFRLMNDMDDIDDKEMERLKNLQNPYDSVDIQSEHNSSIVIQKNNALIANYERFNINNNKPIIEGYDTPFPDQFNQEGNNSKIKLKRIEVPKEEDNNNNNQSCQLGKSRLKPNSSNKKEEMKDPRLYRNDTPFETPGGRNIFSKPEDDAIDKQNEPIDNQPTSNMKINALELPKNVHILKSKTIKEPSDFIDKRKFFIINDNKYSVHSLFDSSTFPFQNRISNDLVQSSYEKGLKNHQSDFDKKTKATDLSKRGFYSIGQAYPFQRLLSLIGTDNTGPYSFPVKQLENDIQLTRNVFSDGDGFYRAIAFSMMEYWIITKSINRIQYMIYKITSDLNKAIGSNDCKIEPKAIIIILMLIAEIMTKETLNAAYELFVKSFATDSVFEHEMIKYIKMSLAEYLTLNSSKFNTTIIEKQIPPEYINNNNHQFMVMKYINEKILVRREEPSNFVISIAPKVFGINVIFYYIEPGNLIRNQFIGNEETNHDKSFITIIKSLGRYEIGYRYSIMFNRVNNYYVEQSYSFKSRFIEKEDKTTCEMCKGYDREISLAFFPEISMCRNCLVNGINATIKKLNKLIKEDHYQHFEFYTQPLRLSPNPLIYLNDEDLFEIIHSTLPQSLRAFISRRCVVCKKLFGSDSYVAFCCGCCFCLDCIKEKIVNETAKKVILNTYEKARGKREKNLPKCSCQKDIDFEEVAPLLFPKEVYTYTVNANDRLRKIMMKLCCVCSKQPMRKVIITIEKINHVICDECNKRFDASFRLSHEKTESSLQKDAKSNQSLSMNNKVECIFCNKEHVIDVTKKAIPQKEDCLNSCCLCI